MAVVSTKVRSDIEKLVELFLTPNAFAQEDEDLNSLELLRSFRYEADVVDEKVEEEAVPKDVKHNDVFYLSCGRTLSRLGDDFFHFKTQNEAQGTVRVDALESVKSSLKEVIDLEEGKETDASAVTAARQRAWESFKRVMESSVTDSTATNAFQQLGAFLLTLNGLSRMGSGVRLLAQQFSLRYIKEHTLDCVIERMGGLDALELD